MKKRLVHLILLSACAGVLALQGARADEPAVHPEPSIPIGEHLVYKISWLWIPVGIGEVWVKEKTMLAGRETIHIVGVIRTNKVLSTIYPMYDKVHSWVDAETLESVQFEKDIRELLLKAHERMRFDTEAKKGYFESFNTGEKKEFPVSAPVHDVLSAFYWVRRQVLIPGETVKTKLFADQKEWALEAHVIESDTLRHYGEKIKVLRIDPLTRVDGEEKSGKDRFYVTDDASHTPVRIIHKAPFGTVVGTLQQSGGSN